MSRSVLIRLTLVRAVVGSVPVASFLLVIRLVVSCCDSSGVGHVAGASMVELVGMCMLRQRVSIVGVGILVLTAKKLAEDTAATLGIARGVVVLGTRAETLLLLVVAGQGPFDEDGEDEEETADVSGYNSLFLNNATYMATMETARQAVSSLHAVWNLGKLLILPLLSRRSLAWPLP